MEIGTAVDRVIGWNAQERVPIGVDLPLRAMHRGLLLVLGTLIPINFVIGYLKWLDYEDSEQPLAFARYFDLGEELAFPAWFSAALLLLAAFTAFSAGQRTEDDPVVRRGWFITSSALAFVSLDEATYLHERVGDPIGQELGAGGIFTWAWVIPGMVVVAALAIRLWPFIKRLPRLTQRYVLLSAAIFVGCALGIEMIDGLAYDLNDNEANVVTEVLTMIEESGEMLAVMLFIDTVATHVAARGVKPAVPNQSSTMTVVDEERPKTSGS